MESKLIRGGDCVLKVHHLKQKGWRPNIISADIGRAESLFLKDIYPGTPLFYAMNLLGSLQDMTGAMIRNFKDSSTG